MKDCTEQIKYLKAIRALNKLMENQHKPPLQSPDVRMAEDFRFTPIMPLGRVGNSGPLLLATSKTKKKEKYLVKYADDSCAANDYVYTKMAQAMDLRMPDAVLFQDPEGEKFITPYIVGTRYLNVVKHLPSFSQIREKAINWKDYFRFRALSFLFLEADGFEDVLADDGYLYQVDISEYFPMSKGWYTQAGMCTGDCGFDNGKDYGKEAEEYIKNYDYKNSWTGYRSSSKEIQKISQKYGREFIPIYIEVYERIQEVPDSYIDDFLNTLCYFYPDIIGQYFKNFLKAAKAQSAEWLKEYKTVTVLQ